jgi:glycosyltransferase involved in cell wall biosynthesis
MRILHIFRSPLGGLFRHVLDLAREQSSSGHQVGLVCDATTGGPGAQEKLQDIEAICALGVTRLPMSRMPARSDLSITRQIASRAQEQQIDVLHGHGAKGGLYARLAARKARIKSVYTPHGGSLHYSWMSPHGVVFLSTEWLLSKIGGGYVFVCEFERQLFEAKIGPTGGRATVVQNGLGEGEFELVYPDPDATDLLFVGEMRTLKGVDLLLEALARLEGVTLTLVGDGPDLPQFEQSAVRLGILGRAKFAGRKPIREALRLGKVMVIPSKHESFPYVMLETIAAGRPLLASRVGGIPEILPDDLTFSKIDTQSIAAMIKQKLPDIAGLEARVMQTRSKLQLENSSGTMASRITRFYETL